MAELLWLPPESHFAFFWSLRVCINLRYTNKGCGCFTPGLKEILGSMLRSKTLLVSLIGDIWPLVVGT